jgi:D-tyrosyl-tRNA(Tyr) deacylase
VRALFQRVSSASVSIDSASLGNIATGFVVLLGVGEGDTLEDAQYLVDKTLNLRVFPNDAGRFDRSLLDISGDLLVVSQFTLYADTRKGRRPSFTRAALPEVAQPLYDNTVELFKQSCPNVVTGRFAEHMVVNIQNDGPVTIMLDSADRETPRRQG